VRLALKRRSVEQDLALTDPEPGFESLDCPVKLQKTVG